MHNSKFNLKFLTCGMCNGIVVSCVQGGCMMCSASQSAVYSILCISAGEKIFFAFATDRTKLDWQLIIIGECLSFQLFVQWFWVVWVVCVECMKQCKLYIFYNINKFVEMYGIISETRLIGLGMLSALPPKSWIWWKDICISFHAYIAWVASTFPRISHWLIIIWIV